MVLKSGEPVRKEAGSWGEEGGRECVFSAKIWAYVIDDVDGCVYTAKHLDAWTWGGPGVEEKMVARGRSRGPFSP